MVNIEFLIIAYIVSLFIDWIFQWQWQAANKSKWNKQDNKMLSIYAVISHSLIYATLTTIITLLLINDWSHLWLVFWTLFISHSIIDTRILVRYILRFKGITWKQIGDYQNFGFMHIGIDHRLHEMILLILAMIVN